MKKKNTICAGCGIELHHPKHIPLRDEKTGNIQDITILVCDCCLDTLRQSLKKESPELYSRLKGEIPPYKKK